MWYLSFEKISVCFYVLNELKSRILKLIVIWDFMLLIIRLFDCWKFILNLINPIFLFLVYNWSSAIGTVFWQQFKIGYEKSKYYLDNGDGMCHNFNICSGNLALRRTKLYARRQQKIH
jgi:hypothetical protein